MYSVVVPIKDERDNIEELLSELEEAMQGTAWELICIDDGSKDGSLELLEALAKHKKYLRIVSFKRNFGQSSAFAAGFERARGTFVITLDGDLQNDPKDIAALISKGQEADLVVGWRVNRKDPFLKRLISRFSNKMRRTLLADTVHDTGCSLKLYRREALLQIRLYEGMHRFLPALFLIEGFRVAEIPVNHRPRRRGKTKYHFFNRLIKPIVDTWAVYWMRRRHLRYEIAKDG